jgi:hypothetical protein
VNDGDETSHWAGAAGSRKQEEGVMKALCWMGLFLLCVVVGWAAEPAPDAADPISEAASIFEQNVALGAALSMRPGTPEEFAQLRALAERGLARAQEAVERDPGSAEAHYWLGSWLVYGYGVIEVDQVSYDPEAGARTETVMQAIQGLGDMPDDGLDALRLTTEIEPENGDYLLDYAVALGDCGRLVEAQGLVKAAWFGEPALSQEQKMQAGLVLSDIAAADGNLAAAREWVYAALSLDQTSAQGVERLRHLDAAQAAEAQAAAEAEQEVYDEEVTYDEEEAGEWTEFDTEAAPESEDEYTPEENEY